MDTLTVIAAAVQLHEQSEGGAWVLKLSEGLRVLTQQKPEIMKVTFCNFEFPWMVSPSVMLMFHVPSLGDTVLAIAWDFFLPLAGGETNALSIWNNRRM